MKNTALFFACLIILPMIASEKASDLSKKSPEEPAVYNIWRSSTIPYGKTLYRLQVLINTCNDTSCEYPWKRNPLIELSAVNPDATIKTLKEYVITQDVSIHDDVTLNSLHKRWADKHDTSKKPIYTPDDFYAEGCKESDQIKTLTSYANKHGYQARILSLRARVIRPCFCLLNGLKKIR